MKKQGCIILRQIAPAFTICSKEENFLRNYKDAIRSQEIFGVTKIFYYSNIPRVNCQMLVVLVMPVANIFS